VNVRLSRFIALVAISTGAAMFVSRLAHGHPLGRQVPGGILIGNPHAYDRLTRLLLGSLFRSIAADIAASAPPGARVLEVGCGPGHLSTRLAHEHGLDVTGLDLDPAMTERAWANATSATTTDGRQPTFVTGDVAALPFDDAAFDLIVSTFSVHHWSDPGAGIGEMARVLRPGGRALIWDLGPGSRLFHAHVADVVATLRAGGLRMISAGPWLWPWRFSLSQRLELARD
jgi:SAM-dependent methyltransferase